jgi:hypothetical protein
MVWVMLDEPELHRLGVPTEIQTGSRTVASGAALLGVIARQIPRLTVVFDHRVAPDSDAGLLPSG